MEDCTLDICLRVHHTYLLSVDCVYVNDLFKVYDWKVLYQGRKNRNILMISLKNERSVDSPDIELGKKETNLAMSGKDDKGEKCQIPIYRMFNH